MFPETLKNVIYWMSLLGVPGVFAMCLFLMKTIIKAIKDIIILQKAQKAQMRSQLLRQYDEHMERGYIEQIYLDDWLNQYEAYHHLVGANAVLDARREDLIHLPNHKVS